MKVEKRMVLLLVVLMAAGCIDDKDRCVDLLSDPEFMPEVFSVSEVTIHDIGQICDTRPFRSIDDIEFQHVISKNCLGVCDEEFSSVIVSLETLSVLEEHLCDSADKDWHREVSYPLFVNFFEQLSEQSMKLNKCIENVLGRQ